jgi:hypothetical protein
VGGETCLEGSNPSLSVGTPPHLYQPSVNDARVVYAIGDSNIGSDQYRGGPAYHLRRIVADRVPREIQFKARGVDAGTSRQVLERLEGEVLGANPTPDACIVLAGVNDLQMGRTSPVVIEDLTAAYSKLLAAGIHPIALTIYPFGGYPAWTRKSEAARQEVRTWMHTVLPRELPGVDVVDVEDVLREPGESERPRIRREYVDHTGLHTISPGGAAVARALLAQSSVLKRLTAPPGLRTGLRRSMH